MEQNLHKFLVMQGIQGSGKTTYAKDWVARDSKNRIRLNRDDLRHMMGAYWVPSRERYVTEVFLFALKQAMNRGYDIVIDNMNLNPKTVDTLRMIVDNHNESSDVKYEYEERPLLTPLNECIKRDRMRENPIGEDVIRDTYNKYKAFYDSHNT